MGHEPGRGLGRTGEGVVEPIKASVARSKVGFGTEGVNELEPEDVEWEEEEVCLLPSQAILVHCF